MTAAARLSRGRRRLPAGGLALLLPLLAGVAMAEEAPEAPDAAVEGDAPAAARDVVQFSDGREQGGELTLAQDLRLHDGTTLRIIPTAEVATITLAPTSEEQVQGWRFPQPGVAKKEPVGAPYPVRHLAATVTTTAGVVVHGHLSTTVAYLIPAGSDERQRLILPSLQEGQPGQTLADLVYPLRLVFHAVTTSAAGTLVVPEAPSPVAFLGLATLPDLAAMTLAGPPPRWSLPAPVRPPVVLAIASGGLWHVAWPARDPAAEALAAPLVAQAQDFLDHRVLLGATTAPQAAPGEAVPGASSGAPLYALVELLRTGPMTMDGPRPWRLEVWRFACEGQRTLWSARAVLARGRCANVQALPGVHLEPGWWQQELQAGVLTVGGHGHGR